MAKTRVNDTSVRAFIDSSDDPDKRAFSRTIVNMMRQATGEEPKMWGSSIVGFGTYTYASGRSGDWMRTDFSPRKANMTLYIMPGFDAAKGQLERLGKCSTGKSCLYVERESDIDLEVPQEMLEEAVEVMKQRYDDPETAKASSAATRRKVKKKASKKKPARPYLVLLLGLIGGLACQREAGTTAPSSPPPPIVEGEAGLDDAPPTLEPEKSVGSSFERPLTACGARESYEVIANLQCPDESRPLGGDVHEAQAARRGSSFAHQEGPSVMESHIVDVYELPCPSGTQEVYLCLYHCPEGRSPLD
jgi:hypothetical protein